MSKQAFDKIAAGLQDAIDLATAERLTGIPAATLSALRSGEMVDVPREWAHPKNQRELMAALGRLQSLIQPLVLGDPRESVSVLASGAPR